MAYADFKTETVEAALGVQPRLGVLFPGLAPIAVPQALAETLAQGMVLAMGSEKARSEFIVAPILLASRKLSNDAFAIWSGERFDVDPARGLVGECDFILALAEPVLRPRSPLMTLVEAKKNDIDLGLGQCIAQMVAAQIFNEREGKALPAIYGCVTTGELWQFLRLEGTTVTIDRARLYIDNVGGILSVFLAIAAQGAGARST